MLLLYIVAWLFIACLPVFPPLLPHDRLQGSTIGDWQHLHTLPTSDKPGVSDSEDIPTTAYRVAWRERPRSRFITSIALPVARPSEPVVKPYDVQVITNMQARENVTQYESTVVLAEELPHPNRYA